MDFAVRSGTMPNCTVVWIENFKNASDPDDSNACSDANELQFLKFLAGNIEESYRGKLGDCQGTDTCFQFEVFNEFTKFPYHQLHVGK